MKSELHNSEIYSPSRSHQNTHLSSPFYIFLKNQNEYDTAVAGLSISKNLWTVYCHSVVEEIDEYFVLWLIVTFKVYDMDGDRFIWNVEFFLVLKTIVEKNLKLSMTDDYMDWFWAK
jgi:hypothetical protein